MKENRGLKNERQSTFIKSINRLSVLTYLITLSVFTFLSCNSDDSEKAESSVNIIKYDNKNYKLSRGLEDVFDAVDNHSSSQINITDGEFDSTRVIIDGNFDLIWTVKNSTMWLYADMYAPGFNGLSEGVYISRSKTSNVNDPSVANNHFFKNGILAIDLNNDGKIENDDNEFIEITGGTVTVKVTGDVYNMDFYLILKNGQQVRGNFKGDFEQV